MRLKKSWKEREASEILQRQLSDTLKVNPIVARILMNRGLTSPQEAQDFMNSGPSSLHSPFLLPDLPKALDRIRVALKQKEKIVVYGDYDVDGVTAISLYLEFFKNLGVPVEYYIPDRLEEGYGLNRSAIQKLIDGEVKLLITADCGTTSIEEISLAQEKGMDVIVTDHHQPAQQPPPRLCLNQPTPKRFRISLFRFMCGGPCFQIGSGFFLQDGGGVIRGWINV